MKKVKLLFLISLPWLMGNTTLTDPTRPPSYQSPTNNEATSPQALSLTAIFVFQTYKVAIINGQPVKLGDHIGEYIITTITPNTVELQGPQQSVETLQLAEDVKTKG